MDLEKKETINEALKGVDHLIHVASPIGAQFKDYESYVNPAREGAHTIIEAAKANKLKKIVITSSCLTLMDVYKDDIKAEFDETDFVEPNKVSGYTDSKIIEE